MAESTYNIHYSYELSAGTAQAHIEVGASQYIQVPATVSYQDHVYDVTSVIVDTQLTYIAVPPSVLHLTVNAAIEIAHIDASADVIVDGTGSFGTVVYAFSHSDAVLPHFVGASSVYIPNEITDTHNQTVVYYNTFDDGNFYVVENATDASLLKYNGTWSTVIVTSVDFNTTRVLSGAFASNTDVEMIYFASSVKHIDALAVAGCTRLQHVYFESSQPIHVAPRAIADCDTNTDIVVSVSRANAVFDDTSFPENARVFWLDDCIVHNNTMYYHDTAANELLLVKFRSIQPAYTVPHPSVVLGNSDGAQVVRVIPYAIGTYPLEYVCFPSHVSYIHAKSMYFLSFVSRVVFHVPSSALEQGFFESIADHLARDARLFFTQDTFDDIAQSPYSVCYTASRHIGTGAFGTQMFERDNFFYIATGNGNDAYLVLYQEPSPRAVTVRVSDSVYVASTWTTYTVRRIDDFAFTNTSVCVVVLNYSGEIAARAFVENTHTLQLVFVNDIAPTIEWTQQTFAAIALVVSDNVRTVIANKFESYNMKKVYAHDYGVYELVDVSVDFPDEPNPHYGFFVVYNGPTGFNNCVIAETLRDEAGNACDIVGVLEGAFADNRSLQRITLPRTVNFVRANAFTGIEDCTITFCGTALPQIDPANVGTRCVGIAVAGATLHDGTVLTAGDVESVTIGFGVNLFERIQVLGIQGGIAYEIVDNTLHVNLDFSTQDTLRVPASGTIDGVEFPVTHVVSLQRPGGFRTVVLPPTVTSIGTDAFYLFSGNLTDVFITGPVPALYNQRMSERGRVFFGSTQTHFTGDAGMSGWLEAFESYEMIERDEGWYATGDVSRGSAQIVSRGSAQIVSRSHKSRSTRTGPRSGGATYVLAPANATTLEVPSHIDTAAGRVPVMRIGANAAAGLATLMFVIVPETVTHIEELAFSGAHLLVSVVFRGRVPDIAPGNFDGLNDTAYYDPQHNTAADVDRLRLFFTNVVALAGICLRGDVEIQTDQGRVPIRDIVPETHTIEGRAIRGVSKTRDTQSRVVRIPAGALGNNTPDADIVCSRVHRVKYERHLTYAHRLVGRVPGVELVPYTGETLYNVLLDSRGTMLANGLCVETLNPRTRIARIMYNHARSATLNCRK